jgi:glycine reductase
LELGIFPITEIIEGNGNTYDDGVLTVDFAALRQLALSDTRLEEIDFEIVRPGDRVRITTVRDQVEPRVKVRGDGVAYPGFGGRPMTTVGSGRTHVLRGMSLFEVSDTVWYPGNDGDVETYLDMFGAGADATPFGSLQNLCVIVTPREGLHIEDQNQAIHGAVLRISDTLANTTRDLEPAEIEVSDLTEPDADLPRVAYVMAMRSPEHYSASQNAHWTGIYGMTRLTPPWLLNPNELFDGAVSGRHSWEHANNPVAWNLAQRHGKDLNFVGCITIRTRWSSQREKFITAQQVASLCQSLRASGAVVSWDSGGNDFMEVIRTIEACENVGVNTVFLTQEESPSSGGPPLLEPLKEADAIVTTGFHGPAGGVATEISSPDRVIGRRMLRRMDPVSNLLIEIDTAGPLTSVAWSDRYGFLRESAFEH